MNNPMKDPLQNLEKKVIPYIFVLILSTCGALLLLTFVV